MRSLALTLALLCASAVAFAADVDGKWTSSVTTPQGDLPIIFVLKADGPKLTGTLQLADFKPADLKDGKIDGDKLTFAAELEFGANVFTLSFNGAQAGDEIKLTIDAMGQSNEIVLKKEKS
jgi:hypothetical protein